MYTIINHTQVFTTSDNIHIPNNLIHNDSLTVEEQGFLFTLFAYLDDGIMNGDIYDLFNDSKNNVNLIIKSLISKGFLDIHDKKDVIEYHIYEE